tara:strand:- start:1796 stop:1939 length:144 start_codon:yes stop_codon:yes gene_type:complete
MLMAFLHIRRHQQWDDQAVLCKCDKRVQVIDVLQGNHIGGAEMGADA